MHPLVCEEKLEGTDHIAGFAGAGGVEHFQTDQMHVWSNTLELIVREQSAAADQASDVRTVTEIVVRRGRGTTLREIEESGDATAEVDTRRDARVDDSDGDAGRSGRETRVKFRVVR